LMPNFFLNHALPTPPAACYKAQVGVTLFGIASRALQCTCEDPRQAPAWIFRIQFEYRICPAIICCPS
jgi:hypothetical protein